MKNNIKTARENKGFTQQECADLFGIKIRAWQTYEQGVSEPKYELLCKIADVFGVTTDYLLGREQQSDPLALLGIRNDEKSALDAYLKLDEKNRQIVIDAMIALGDAARKSRELSSQELRQMITKKFSFLPTSAGSGEWLDDENIEYKDFPDSPQVREADLIIPVEGSSMEPEISDGDELCIKLCDAVKVGETGVFIVDGRGYVKELGEDRLISLNEEYDDIYAAEYKCVGKVIGKVE